MHTAYQTCADCSVVLSNDDASHLPDAAAARTLAGVQRLGAVSYLGPLVSPQTAPCACCGARRALADAWAKFPAR
jgi:hypothetical protein